MDETHISRGFKSKRQEQTPKKRLPPGQYVTTDFPVLSAGPTPQIKVADWTFALQLNGSLLGKWNWEEFEALRQTTIKTDIHCVTKWSKLDTTWQGVTFDDLLKAVGLSEPPAPYIMAHCDGAYTTNVPVADLVGGRGMVVTPTMVIPGKSRDMTATEISVSSRRIEWQLAEVRDVVIETPRVKSLLLRPVGWPGHLPGQHVDIRLTAGDGYQAQRSYSIASPPEDELLALTVERVKDGEVSPYLLDELRAGDQLELRGPIGGYFVWTGAMGSPLCLIAGGAGVTPLMAMLRHRDRSSGRAPAVLMYSARSLEDVIYRDEIDAMARRDNSLRVVHALTREQPKGWMGHRGRIDKTLLAANCFPPSQNPAIYVCGPTAFVESVSGLLVELQFDPLNIKTERFGPSGG